MGRLFDAVAALCGLPPVTSFEGQAAIALESVAALSVQDAYPMPLSDDAGLVVDWEPMIRAILEDRKAELDLASIAARFHNGLAEVAVRIAQHVGCPQIVLSGGCFQNALLSDRLRTDLLAAGFTVYTHNKVPPGDGGISLGQVLVAARQIQSGGVSVRSQQDRQ